MRRLCILCSILVLPLSTSAQNSADAPEDLVAEGNSLLAAGDLDAARTAYTQAVDLRAHLVPALLGLTRVALRERRYDDAVDHATHVLKYDPDHLEAHYLRGIAHREKEKSYTLLTNSLTDFEFVLARDSLFRNVLYQYGLTLAYRRQYRDDRTRAVTLAERQLQLKPDDPEAFRGLFDIYTRYTRQLRWKRALVWLEQRNSAYATYFGGQLLWRKGRFLQADSAFASLLTHPHDGGLRVPAALIFLARARTHYTLGDPVRAQRYLDAAFAAIEDERTAYLIFDDFKYIVSIDEWEQFQQLQTVEDYRAFFRTLWAKRDPTPADPVNARLVEHYRRLHTAEQEFLYTHFRGAYSAPIATRYLDFPPVYELGAAFDDRGIIYVRHGEPDERGVELYSATWHYSQLGMSFYFKVQTTKSSRNSMFGEISGVGNFRLQSLSYRGLTTDHHQWDDETVLFDFPHTLAAFRGDDGRTQLDVYYVLPVGFLTQATETIAPPLDVDVGLALHDSSWQEVGSYLDTKHLTPTDDASAGSVDLFRLTVQPDSYHVALHMRADPALGHYRFDYQVPDFSCPELQLSDVLPAYTITPADPEYAAARNGLHILPNPSGRFPADRFVYVYFEIYGLTFGDEDLTRYSVEYTLEPLEERRRLLDLFDRDDRSALSIESTLEGTERSPVEYGEIDVREVPPGRYRLRVTVTDEHLGTSVERVREIELVE